MKLAVLVQKKSVGTVLSFSTLACYSTKYHYGKIMKKTKPNISDFLLISITILPLLFSSSIFFLKDPPVWPDEPHLYVMARNLLTTGKPIDSLYPTTNTLLIESGLGYPPVYLFSLGNWTNIFGSSIESVRSLSLIFGLISLIIFFYISKQLFNDNFLATIGTFALNKCCPT